MRKNSEMAKSEGLGSLINPFLHMEVHQLEEQPYHIKERYQQVERAEKLYQKFYNGLYHFKIEQRWHIWRPLHIENSA